MRVTHEVPTVAPEFHLELTQAEAQDMAALFGRCAGLGQVYNWYASLAASLREAGVAYDPSRVTLEANGGPITPVVKFTGRR